MTTIKKIHCSWQSPKRIADLLIEEWGDAGFIWLDGDGSHQGRWVTLGVDPIEQICCRDDLSNIEQTNNNPFDCLKNLSPGHWTGWLSYEAGAWIEPKNPWKKNVMANLWIASHDPVIKFDLKNKKLWIEGTNQNRLQKIENLIKKTDTLNIDKEADQNLKSFQNEINIPLSDWEWITKKEDFTEKIKQIKTLIKEGDIFQANLSACCQTSLNNNCSPIEIYLRLREYSPAPFSGVVIGADAAKNEAVISSSPERFLKVLPNGLVESRPIKGTRPRFKDQIKDTKIAVDLISCSKDRAENIMIVDLLRNDLGKVCKPGSITVPQLLGLETFPQVHHLTSIIQGKLREDKTWVDALEAAWPGGSITGAPKLRACRRIYEFEPIARGPYCGSLLNIRWDGTFDSSIIIRSLMVHNSTIQAHAGCGIVADSDPEEEAKELEWKLLPLLKSLQ